VFEGVVDQREEPFDRFSQCDELGEAGSGGPGQPAGEQLFTFGSFGCEERLTPRARSRASASASSASPSASVWRASQIPDSGPNKVRSGMEEGACGEAPEI